MKLKSIQLGVDYIEGEVIDANINFKNHYNVDMLKVNTKHGIHEIIPGIMVNATGAFAGKYIEMLKKAATIKNINTPTITSLPVEAKKRNIFVFNCNIPDNTPIIIPPRNTPLVIDPTGIWFRYVQRYRNIYI